MRGVLNITQCLECHAYARNHTKLRGKQGEKKSQVLVGKKCALGLPAKAYRGNKTKGILEREKRQS